MLDSGLIITKSDTFLEAEMGEELVMMSMENNAYYGFDKIGKIIWEMLKEPISIQTLLDRLTERYDVSEQQCLDDITPFLEKLRDENLIDIS